MRAHQPGDLFVPLKGEWFDKFKDGTKEWEHRLMRRQWTVAQCAVGRRVTLSRGYSGERLYGVITQVEIVPLASTEARSEYPDASHDAQIISFRIALEATV